MINEIEEEKKSEFNEMFALWQGRGKVAFPLGKRRNCYTSRC